MVGVFGLMLAALIGPTLFATMADGNRFRLRPALPWADAAHQERFQKLSLAGRRRSYPGIEREIAAGSG